MSGETGECGRQVGWSGTIKALNLSNTAHWVCRGVGGSGVNVHFAVFVGTHVCVYLYCSIS